MFDSGSSAAERVGDLQRNAATWFGELGMTDEALRNALAAQDLAMAAKLIEHGLCDALNREDRPALERWLHLLPDELIQGRPGLLIVRAWSQHWFGLPLGKVLARVALLLEEDGNSTSPANELRIVRGQMLELYGKEAYDANDFANAMRYCMLPITALILGVLFTTSMQSSLGSKAPLLRPATCGACYAPSWGSPAKR
jgi:ATP/maltotriose-dependent transcriptional regulator MalT